MQTILKKIKNFTIKTNEIKVFCIATYSQKLKNITSDSFQNAFSKRLFLKGKKGSK